jgi:hypothetical protein
LARQNPYEIFQLIPEIYPKLVQYREGNFYDGRGNLIIISQVINPDDTKLLISNGTKNGIITVSQLAWSNGKLAITGNLKLNDGSEKSGYVLVSDAIGNASWTSSINFYYQNVVPNPTPTNVGSRWINSDSGIEYVWIYDGANYNWVQPTQLWSSQYMTDVISTPTYSVSFMFEYYGVTYNSGTCSVYLPTGTSPNDDGKFITIADEVGGISTWNRGIYVFGNGTQSINGYSSVLMKVNFMSLTFMFRNNSWKTI